MSVTLEIRGLDELQKRLQNTPHVFEAGLRKTMSAALLILWENVPGYPPKPQTSKYTRTGTLGRTIGVSESGQKQGQPEVYEVKRDGQYIAGKFGTRLNYAPYVIGARYQSKHMHHWWTLDGNVVEKAVPKITEAFRLLARKLAEYIARGSSV